jgi:glutamate/tyrosine decarboxylase-like PLP-dependent enzyme
LVNVYTKMSSQYDRIDLNDCCRQIEEDIANKKIPHILIANAGSLDVGQCDNIQQLERICTHYKIWLHLDGFYLSTLALYSVPSVVQVK